MAFLKKKTWQKMLKSFLFYITNQMMNSIGNRKNTWAKVAESIGKEDGRMCLQ